MRLTRAVISKSNLIHNLNEVKRHSNNSKILALVKANAYGHGIIEVSKILEEQNVDFLGVAYLDEALKIRDAGINSEIISLVQEFNNVELFYKYNIQPAISTIDFLTKLNKKGEELNQKLKVHIYIDTGMSRDGFMVNEIEDLILSIKNMPSIIPYGIFTHLSSSASDKEFSKLQINKFKSVIEKFNKSNINFDFYHCINSGALSNLELENFNLIRIGLSIYGYPPMPQSLRVLQLKPVMSLETKIIFKRRILKGDPVSYEILFITEKDTTIATIPIGYGDGYFKLLTNKAECIIKGKFYPIVGAICMDECMIDIGDDDIELGTKVTLIGQNENNSISAYDLANKIGTIPYEITTSISSRVDRFYEE